MHLIMALLCKEAEPGGKIIKKLQINAKACGFNINWITLDIPFRIHTVIKIETAVLTTEVKSGFPCRRVPLLMAILLASKGNTTGQKWPYVCKHTDS